MAVGVGSRAFDVAGMADGDQHLSVGDEVFELDFVDLVDNLRAAVVAVSFLYFLQLASDDLLQLFVACKYFFQFGDLFADGSQARSSAASGRFAFQGAELVLAAVELHAFEFFGLAVFGDGDVLLGEIFEQVFLGFGAAGRSADDADDVVKMVERDLVADQNVFALAGFAQLVDSAAANNFDAVIDEQLDERDETKLAGLSGNDGQQDHAKRFLHLRVLEKIVEDELRFFAALDFDDDAHAFARGFVAHVGDAFDFFRLHQVGDTLDEPRFVDLVWNLGDDNVFAVFADFFDRRFGAHHETAAF